MSHGHHHDECHVTDDTPATEALTKLLLSAQAAHKKCVSQALKEGADVVDKCALTWGDVHLRWQAWAAYRPPFQTDEAEDKYRTYWTRARVEEYEKKQAFK
jgi:hypothetical protein